MKPLQREPLATVGTIVALIGAAIVLAQSFGVPISDDQKSALTDFFTIAAPLVVAMIGRGMVFAPRSVEELTTQAYEAGTPPTQPRPQVPPPSDEMTQTNPA
jgi:hypothetical protein